MTANSPKSTKFRPEKVHTVFMEDANPQNPIVGRKYTLTHSDRTGDLYLCIGLDTNTEQISGLYTRWMRDEVLGEWCEAAADTNHSYELHIHVHVSGGRVYGRPKNRNAILVKELPRALCAIHYGDAILPLKHPEVDKSPVIIHFHSDVEKYDRTENWGVFGDYTVPSTLVKVR